ncbi:hypothetical protein [Fervidicoccus fontis]|uniref:hypothetical protein n=1 Tax=Fervidicoccus fontis TaxID=683846 RepID=UPI0011E5641D|nr:hypothetical protein [Fervidicoccus fontis]
MDFARMFGRKVVVGSERIFWMVEQIRDRYNSTTEDIYMAIEGKAPPPILLNAVSIEYDILQNPRDYILIVEPINLLEILRRMKLWGKELKIPRAVAVLTDPEPNEGYKEVEESVLAKWFEMLGIEVYRLRLSGHYYPHQFSDLIGILRPKEIVPIHTENPYYMKMIFEKLKK